MPAAAIGVGSSLLGGILGSSAAGKAADAQTNAGNQAVAQTTAAANTAISTDKGVYQTDQASAAPYQQAGAAALSQMGSSVLSSNANPGDILANDPGYQFRLDQGTQALQRAQAAGGSIGSGGAMKAAARYSQDYASGEYGAAYNRMLQSNQQRFGQLSNLAGMGQTANGQMINAGSAYGAQAGQVGMQAANENTQTLTGIGNAQASGYVGAANAWSGALSGIGKATSAIKWPGDDNGPDVNTPTWNPATGQEVYPTR